MTRSTSDLAALLRVMMNKDYTSSLTISWEGQRIAFVDPTIWYIREGPWDHVPNIMNKYFVDIAAARDLIQSNGGKVVKDVRLPSFDTLDFEGSDGLKQIWDYDFAKIIATFLGGYSHAPVRTKEELIEFNYKNPETALPGEFAGQRVLLEDAIRNPDRLSEEKYEEAKALVRKGAGANGYNKIFKEHGVVIVAGPLDSRMGSMAAAAGLPSVTVPLGYADFFNGRAYGLSIIAGEGREDQLVEFMSAWEATHPGLLKPPPQLRPLGV